jgi:hypothetical protein
MPLWARKRPGSDGGPQAAGAGSGRRRAASTSTTTASAGVGAGRLPGVPRGDSMTRRTGSASSLASGGSAGGKAAAGGGAGSGGAAAVVKKGGGGEYSYAGPDGDLVANLERDVLDRSPGIRCAAVAVCCVLSCLNHQAHCTLSDYSTHQHTHTTQHAARKQVDRHRWPDKSQALT